MKKVGLIGCIAVLLLLGGCGNQNVKQSARHAVSKVEPKEWDPNVLWDGNAPAQDAMPDFLADNPQSGAFPESMVGVWEVVVNEYTGSKWGIKFEPDGSIKKIIHFLAGPVNIDQGGVEINGPDVGSYYLFHIGACEARYIPETRIVKVKIIVDYFIMNMPAGELEGRMEDYIESPVSEDGKTWNVKWWNFGWLKDASMPDINMIKANPVPLVFTKLDKEDANKF